MYDLTTGKIFGAALKHVLREQPRGTQARLAEAMNKESSYIADIKQGRGGGTEETRRYIASFLNVPYEEMLAIGRAILRGEESAPSFRMPEPSPPYGADGLTTVPFLEAVPAMGGESQRLSRQARSHLAFRTDWLRTKGNPERMVVVRADGDSMHPTIQDGSIVLCDESRTEFADGRIFLVELGDGIVIKRLRSGPDGPVIVSDNGNVETPVRPGEHFRIRARCVWTARELD
ncbi:putative phage repressor [Desulfovibrio sp. X2]|uniref:XRE family transcriptional regulator n=1 Tax=Desulfovibrio sp. X2 TaxID=941449 RepID=UPI000358E54E|nr:LexA family transcriptional regulator [Desulfovibrio sp. X2]EPR39659.1 putative phage repressor [Desulfovibrio sp. X2]